MLDKLLSKLERKWGRYAIRNLMSIILVGMVVIYCFDIIIRFNPNAVASVSSLFDFNLAKIKAGQIWRVFTFVFLPPNVEILFAVFEFYMIWLFGVGLERKWGSFKFNVFFFTGMLSTAIVGWIVGQATNTFMLTSMFLAFAILFPDFEMLLFFIIPIKIKWLGWLTGAGLIFWFIIGSWVSRFLILASFANLLLFFGGDCFGSIYYRIRKQYYKFRRSRIKRK
ncbi:MAG: hypothetical protein IK130_01340 [Oscillospiraceae bacterium]|nr:hypothetical protein [Oscillospiraceae bacterium]